MNCLYSNHLYKKKLDYVHKRILHVVILVLHKNQVFWLNICNYIQYCFFNKLGYGPNSSGNVDTSYLFDLPIFSYSAGIRGIIVRRTIRQNLRVRNTGLDKVVLCNIQKFCLYKINDFSLYMLVYIFELHSFYRLLIGREVVKGEVFTQNQYKTTHGVFTNNCLSGRIAK